MRNRTLRAILLAALLALGLPLAGDATPVPTPSASQAACCNTFDEPPTPISTGDEAFFKIPGGVPNVMLVLDSSGSMVDLPRDIDYPSTWPASNGTCTGRLLNAKTPKTALGAPDTTRLPFDNGYNNDGGTYDTVDDPPWGMKKCTVTQPRPATDNTTDFCLFRADSYYKTTGTNGANFAWSNASAKVYNANPCAAVTTSGGLVKDSLNNTVLANDVAECQACLASAGFYMMRPKYNGGAKTADAQIVFAGWFLNANPPKYVAARKVVKDLARLDATARPTTDQVRFGLTIFSPTADGAGQSSSLQAADGGQLVVPLGPNCDDSFPYNRPKFSTARQALINAVNDTAYVSFGGNTPLAETLLNVGQYFSNTGASALYTSLFTASWMRTSFNETASGSIGATRATWTGSGQNQHSFCWACQQSSVIVVTDGAPNGDVNLPKSPTPATHSTFNQDFRAWSNPTVDCATCGTDLSNSSIKNMMHKVAYFLNQTDLRPDLSNGGTTQNLSVYTISFGIDATASAADAAAVTLLQKTASLGGGLFSNTSSGEELRAALDQAVSDVVSRATSFSSANANSLQTSKSTSADAYLGRFRPNNSAMWEGHLFAATLFDEFGQGCDSSFPTAGQRTFSCGIYPARNPNLNEDQDSSGKAICSGAYVVDSECDPIVEDATGNFKKAHFDPTTHALLTDPDDAALWWDAGKVLSTPTATGYRSADEAAANARSIWTVIDRNANGKFDGPSATYPSGEMVPFTAENAAALAPLMNLPALAQASTTALPTTGVAPATSVPWCNDFLNRIGVCGVSPLPTCGNTVALVRTKCAENIIHFYRGWDVLDWDGDHCAGPGNYYNTNGWGSCTTSSQCGGSNTCTGGKCFTAGCAAGEQRDRVNDSRSTAAQEFWKLGDIFHSSPVLVKPPIGKFSCDLALENQCALTLYSGAGQEATVLTRIASSAGLDAYDTWRSSLLSRRQLVVVGANDGMLHAFDAGVPDVNQPPNFEGVRPHTSGTGEERWAFLPPDILPRLRDGLYSHFYGVDGNTMVRDIWVDTNQDGTKQQGEFKTIAIITERGGGQRWTALDITDTESAPKFLWTFPEPCSEDSKLAGQSWSDFLPRPAPIGAVRLAVAPNSTRDPDGRGFEERWVVMLNGGYDPTLVRGRVVWMLDAWSGKVVWRYRDADLKAMRGDTKAQMLPVAASVAMMDIGQADRTAGLPRSDTYFDTATWADVGGTLFTARFFDPGTVDAVTGLVTNWAVARAFEPNRQADDTHVAAGRGEAFYMTGNILDGPSRLLSSFGTGNRDNLMQVTPQCGPNNITGCCATGCTVTSAVASSSFGTASCSQGGTFQCSSGTLTFAPAATSACGTQASPHACGASSSSVTSTVTLTFNCGAAGSPGPLVAQVTCDSTGVCSAKQPFTTAATFSTSAIPGAQLTQNRFQTVWSYGKSPLKRFDATAGSARAFDEQRFTDVAFTSATKCAAIPATAPAVASCQLVETNSAQLSDAGSGLAFRCRAGAGTKCAATRDDPGWMYTYGQYCPTETCTGLPWRDEKSAGQGLPFGGCTTWSSFRPTGATATTDPCTSSAGTPTAFNYIVDSRTGAPTQACGFKDTSPVAFYQAQQQNAFAPPQNSSMRISLNDKGQVNSSNLRINTGSGAQKTDLGTRSSVGEPLYWLEVPRALHTCRHVDPTTCK